MTLEILIIEDRAENREAAKKARPEDMNFSYARNFNEGKKEIESGKYDGAIIDVQMPKDEGQETEILGYELADLATEYAVPRVILTSFHHSGHDWGLVQLDEIEGLSVLGRTHPKSDPRSWTRALNLLQEIADMHAMRRAKERYQRGTGKPFRRNEK